ncbi:MAG: porin [Candidatus Tokpelaia sp.]|nr:MAG: porin [Candidatus Tokpelaia sp.]KAA6206898.1 MAG: porin [Candidatus Tokpelaia sp.]
MKIKTLLFVFFAAAAALPARANDYAPQPEPEETGLVRACDAFGQGYFYIPGTNSCLRISGYLRADNKGGDGVYAMTYGDRRGKSYDWLMRATLRVHTASQTEWGPLRTFMELRSDWHNGSEGNTPDDNSGGDLRFGYIELGGLRVGIDETIFAYWTGYYGNMISDDIMNPTDKRTNVIAYTFNHETGFSAILGFEQGNTYDGNGTIPGDLGRSISDGADNTLDGSKNGGYRFRSDGSKHYKELSSQTHDYTPNIVGGLKYEKNWGSIAGVIGYEPYYSEWEGKIRLDANLTNRLSLFAMGGYKSMEDYYNLDTSYGDDGARIIGYRADGSAIKRYGLYRQVNSNFGDWGGHGIYWLGGTYKFSHKTSLNFQNAYGEDRSFAHSTNITKDIVDGLTLVCEVTYKTWHNKYGRHQANGDEYRLSLKDKEALQGAVRLQRSF